MNNEMTTDNMSNEEVIEVLKGIVFNGFDRTTRKERQALDLAIKALEERPQGDLISREALLKAFANSEHIKETVSGLDVMEMLAIKEIIDNTPAVEPNASPEVLKLFAKYVAEYKRPQGEWIHNGINIEGMDLYRCSICNRSIVTWSSRIDEYPYCHCGARMIGGAE